MPLCVAMGPERGAAPRSPRRAAGCTERGAQNAARSWQRRAGERLASRAGLGWGRRAGAERRGSDGFGVINGCVCALCRPLGSWDWLWLKTPMRYVVCPVPSVVRATSESISVKGLCV